jgi:hypothetical protein
LALAGTAVSKVTAGAAQAAFAATLMTERRLVPGAPD